MRGIGNYKGSEAFKFFRPASADAIVQPSFPRHADDVFSGHFTLRTTQDGTGSGTAGNTGGVIFSEGGVHPYLRQVDCTSAPLVHR